MRVSLSSHSKEELVLTSVSLKGPLRAVSAGLYCPLPLLFCTLWAQSFSFFCRANLAPHSHPMLFAPSVLSASDIFQASLHGQ